MRYGVPKVLLNVADVGVRITKGLNIYEFGVRLNGRLQCIVIVWVDKCCINAILAQRVLQQIIGSAVDGIGSHHMVTGVCQVGDGVSYSCCTRGNGQAAYTAFQCGNAILKNSLSSVGQTAIDVSCILQVETITGVLASVAGSACSWPTWSCSVSK